MEKDFLLNSKKAVELYDMVKDLPIIDYHNHLSLSDIKANKRFCNVYDLWIKPDPYKHRAMRMCGVEEKYITGGATDEEKFIKWCENFKNLLGNPLYHWSLMELETVFEIKEIPSKENAKEIYISCNEFLSKNNVTAKSLMEKFNVELACPCASLVDDISLFEEMDGICPSLRGDDIVDQGEEFISKLSAITKIDIASKEDLKKAIKIRLDQFEKCGLVFADHALDNGFTFDKEDEKAKMLLFLGEEYSKRNLIMQLHIGAQRYTSTKLRRAVGPAGGFAGIGNSVDVKALTSFLDALDIGEYGLPKTVIFTLNPADNALVSVLSGSYSKDGVSGLITQGPAWWWCDHKQGIVDMLDNTTSFSLLSNFLGMTTDSRSFLSFVRHDYFRRIICDYIGKKVEDKEFICSDTVLKELLHKLCYLNAKNSKQGR